MRVNTSIVREQLLDYMVKLTGFFFFFGNFGVNLLNTDVNLDYVKRKECPPVLKTYVSCELYGTLFGKIHSFLIYCHAVHLINIRI
jgi:hypothetical protein